MIAFYNQSVQDALSRLKTFYNGNAYNAVTNPGGMAQGGHRNNFVSSLQDVCDVGAAVAGAAEAARIAGSQAAVAVADRTVFANVAGVTAAMTSVSLGSIGLDIRRTAIATTETIAALVHGNRRMVTLTGTTATDLQGIAAGIDGQELVLRNVDTAVITLRNESGAAAAARICTGTGADLTLDQSEAMQLVYDGTAARWCVIGPVTAAGIVLPYGGGGTVPHGWRACDGSALSRTTYAALFAVIGTAYGAGDGSATFTLPDLRGRTLIGAGQGAGLTNRALGAAGGAETHTLTIAEMPAHHHTAAQGLVGIGPTELSTGPAYGRVTLTTADTGGGSHNNMQP